LEEKRTEAYFGESVDNDDGVLEGKEDEEGVQSASKEIRSREETTNLVHIVNLSSSRQRLSLVLVIVHVERIELVKDEGDIELASHLDEGGERLAGDDLAGARARESGESGANGEWLSEGKEAEEESKSPKV
jgi:hypothetical protein